ncbi:MAG: endolytic transglycosylase MltG [Flavobacteriaceae bacterium]|nr:endolytic transglycosylase MltG [Flavobacteriaceae bacterium]
MNKKNLLLLLTALVVIMASVLTYSYYSKIYKPNTVKEGYLYIPSDASYQDVANLLRPFVKRVKPLNWVANKKNYPAKIKAGRYFIKKGMNNNALINLLRSGNQQVLKLSFNNQDTLEKLAGRIAAQIEADSISLLKAFKAPDFLTKNNFNVHTAISMYIPNSYEFYWNTSADKFKQRMLKEYHRFWNTQRKAKAVKQGLSPLEVTTLASIVQKETASISERPDVAQLYLNRLNNNWPLQADPTVIYAIKELKGQETVIKRVLLKDLKIKSAYNTYQISGLPPGPIGMPDISAIDAVLSPAKHRYFYMCADINTPGKHVFAKTLSQHNRNARKYQQWLNRQGVRR